MRSLQCVAYRTTDRWQAICLDLDIAVQGDTLSDVQSSLRSAVEGHIEQAMTLDEPARSCLMMRSVPWHVRAKFAILLFLATLFAKQRREAVIGFPTECPV